jgi:hypothetical protein
MGLVAATDAVRRPEETSAISPKTSPGPSVAIRVPSCRTSAVPSSIAKNPWPKSPSVVSATPASTSYVPATSATAARSAAERPAKSGIAAMRASSMRAPYVGGDLDLVIVR